MSISISISIVTTKSLIVKLTALTVGLMTLSGCVATMKEQVLDTGNESQLQKRSYQTRAFDTTDKQKVKTPKDAVPHHRAAQHQQRCRTGGQAGKISHKPTQCQQR